MKKVDLQAYTIIATNLLPLLGVILFDWKIQEILMIYWCETLIVGFSTILKIFCLEIPTGIMHLIGTTLHKFGTTVIFILMFGGFCILNLAFLAILSRYTLVGELGPLAGLESLINYSVWENIKWTLMILILTYTNSFYSKYIKTFEYKRAEIKNLILEPYQRVFLLLGSIVVVVFIIQYLNLHRIMPILLAIFIIGKILMELHTKDKFKRRIYA